MSFNDHIHPYAIELTKSIVDYYLKNRTQEEAPSGNFDDMTRSPVAYIQAISKIIMSVCKDSKLIAKLENIMMPMIHTSLEPMGVEITDECIECAIVLMFHGESKVSPLM
jgi:hypothetical protein